MRSLLSAVRDGEFVARSGHRRFFLFITFYGVFSSLCIAQIDTGGKHTDNFFRSILKDSLRSPDATPGFKKYQPAKKPWVAVGLSAALPGAGQIYNESYWKVPVIWGLGGYWIYEWRKQNDLYQQYRQKYQASISQVSAGNALYKELRDFYRDQRDSFAWYLGALYFLNLVDAYVGANLYDFDVSPDLGANGKIVPKVTASFRVKF